MSKGKLWGIILLILFVLGFGIWLYTGQRIFLVGKLSFKRIA